MSAYDEARAAVAAGTSPEEAAASFVALMTPEERLWCLDGDAPTWDGLRFLGRNGYHMAPFHAARVERLGLPGFSFADGPRGAVIGNATCFPVTMARGATWDPDLEEQIGEAIGRELRASGATLTGAVCVNVLRHPAWGRAQETYGEDPHHVGELGAALTRGLQRHVMASVKHFACNSMENARFTVDVEVDEVALHEVFLPHFRRVVDEGVASVMSAYNAVNGEWCGQNRMLLTDVLRDEWGFAGFVISDWIFGLRNAARSVTAGLDVEMPYRMVRATHLPDALERGEASWDDVDAAVRRVVATLLRFDRIVSGSAPDAACIGSSEHRGLARVAAARSVVLLRNEPIDGEPVLPLSSEALSSEEPPSIAVIGSLAARVNLGDGGSSDVWALECVTVLDGVRAVAPNATYHAGDDVESAAAVAARADVAVVVVGYTFEDEGEFIGETGADLRSLLPPGDEADVAARFAAELDLVPPIVTPPHVQARGSSLGFARGGDRTSLRLHPDDVALVQAVAAANPRTVVVIQSGSAVLTGEWDGVVAAVVQAWYGGSEAGHGLADVLFGFADASGRLPFTVPAHEAHLPAFDRSASHAVYDRWHGWWHAARAGHEPTYPFGFGLSYTTFEVADVACALDGHHLRIDGIVRNTGHRDGGDVVQVYVTLPDADAPARLAGFTRVEVPTGGAAPFVIDVPLTRLASRDPATHTWRPVTGQIELAVGRYAADPAAHRLTMLV